MFLTGLNGWVFVYEISGCGTDSCYSYLNFRYRANFEQGAPWHSDNCRVYIHSKTWMWHDTENTQLKISCRSTVLLIYSKVKTSQIPHDGTTPFIFTWQWKDYKKNHAYLTACNKYSTGYWRNILANNICHWVDIYRLL